MKKIVFATNNPNKLKEAKEILKDRLEIVSLAEINCCEEIPETAPTLEGNAIQKARWIKDRYGFDCFADDTGLMVDKLEGAPGVLSARYAGENCTPLENMQKLLLALEGVTDRKACFKTVIAYVTDTATELFEGRVGGVIADKAEGAGGFGYDPIFIPSETGVRFSEMSAADKNKISHRGRALRKFADFLGIFIFLCIAAFSAISASASQWRFHPSYDGQMEEIAVTSDFVYFLGTRQQYEPTIGAISNPNGVLFRFSKSDESLETLDVNNLLSGYTIRAVAYNYAKKYLAVAYDDGKIDLIKDSGEVVSINGLMAADSSIDKSINSFSFDPENDKIYAATNFGYVVFNDRLNEIVTSRIFNKKCNAVVPFKGNIWIATDKSLYYGSPDQFDLSMFNIAPGVENVKKMIYTGSEVYMLLAPEKHQIVSSLHYDGKECWASPLVLNPVYNMTQGKGGVTILSEDGLMWLGVDGQSRVYSEFQLPGATIAGSDDGKTYWISCGRAGIKSLMVTGDSWSVKYDNFLPNASNAFMCASMAYHPEYGLLVRNHGYEMAFGSMVVPTDDLISGYKDMNWRPLSATYRVDMPGLRFDNPSGLAIDPSNTNHVYCGSVRAGLLRLDLDNPEKSIHMSKPSDVNGGHGYPGFAAIVPDNDPTKTWGEQCVFAAPKFDVAGNLWTAFVNPEKVNSDHVSSYTELWIWPESARKATTSAVNVTGWKQIRFDDVETDNLPMILPLRAGSNKNIVLHCGNTVKSPILIFDHNGTIDNRSDDKFAKMKSIVDQDGTSVPFVKVHTWYEDENTGLVWVSYGTGLFTFNPKEALTNPTSVRRVKVSRNDGTNLADYLLDNVQVNYITADPTGRKWFGTSGAGLVCTSSDGRQILATYTPDNSMLAGNSVYSMCYNPATNSMMISTDKGLCELFLSGASDSTDSSVRSYPNPVRPDYYGYVTIDGLEQEAMVKIVDAAGNLIKECGAADNGSLQWDLTNIFFKRVPAGVYYVVASNGPNSDSYSEVSKILVVN